VDAGDGQFMGYLAGARVQTRRAFQEMGGQIDMISGSTVRNERNTRDAWVWPTPAGGHCIWARRSACGGLRTRNCRMINEQLVGRGLYQEPHRWQLLNRMHYTRWAQDLAHDISIYYPIFSRTVGGVAIRRVDCQKGDDWAVKKKRKEKKRC